MNGPPAAYEGHYASVIHSCFLMRGFEPVGEESVSRDRADMALRLNGQVYLFEFKVVDRGPEGTALAQLKARGHADKYRDLVSLIKNSLSDGITLLTCRLFTLGVADDGEPPYAGNP